MSRRLNLAVVASLVLHAAVLVLLPMLDAQRPPAPPVPMTARLVEQPRPVAPKAEAPAPQPPSPPRPEPPRPVPKPAPKPEQKAVEIPRPAEPPRPAAPPVSQSAPVIAVPPAPSPQPAPPVPPQPAQRSEPAVAAAPPQGGAVQPSQASSAAMDATTIGQYRVQLIELAGRYKRYPRLAQDNNWTGTAEVRLSVGADGAIAALSVRKASGHGVLDSEALNMIRTAFGKLPMPESLRGKAFSIDVPVVFSLKDE